MATSKRFYPNQSDYIEQLNLLDDQMQAGAGGTVGAGVTSFNSRGGPVTLFKDDVLSALTFTPYDSSNPNGYINNAALTSYAQKNNPNFTGTVGIPTLADANDSDSAASTKWARRKAVQGGGAFAVPFSSTPNLDCALHNNFDITLTGNISALTLSNPTDGQRIVLRIKQDGIGGRSLAFSAGTVRFSEDMPSLTISATPFKLTYVGLVYHAADERFDLVSVNKGF